ncbi:hypothetical protein GCM10022217_17190 [Chryseobacterium ginsenosidimutans]
MTVICFILHSCVNDEIISSSDPISKEYHSKSLWKEDEKYIKNIMKIYTEHEKDIKKSSGIPDWYYAMSMGKYDESFMVVPIIENGKVINTLACARFDKKVYFRYENSESNKAFFQNIIYGKYTQYKTDPQNNTNKGTQKGMVCITKSISMWYPDNESNPSGGGYWETNYYTNCYNFLDYSGPGWEDNGGGGFEYGGGGGSGSNDSDNPVLTMPPPPNIPIQNMTQFLSCLNITQPANLKVFAERMGNGHGVGHAFISITQGNNTMTFGFYPKYGAVQSLSGTGIFGDDSGHVYTNAWNAGTITPTQLQQIIAVALEYSTSDYDLGFNNCSDFTLNVLDYIGVSNSAVGIATPNTVANLIGSPANGTAPATHRTCN